MPQPALQYFVCAFYVIPHLLVFPWLQLVKPRLTPH